MDEEENTAVSSAARQGKPKRSNWWMDALAAGAGASFVGGPLVGIGVGLARGLSNWRTDQNALDQMMADREAVEAANTDIDGQLQRMSKLPGITDIDREQLNTLQGQRQLLSRLMNSSDSNVRQTATDRYLSLMADANSWLEDVESRQESQQDAVRSTYVDSFKDLRDRYRNTQDSVVQSKRSSEELLEFIDGLSDDELNKPINRGRIAQLIETSARALTMDTPDVLDAVGSAVGGVGGVAPNPILAAITGVVQGGLEAIKAGDFKIKGSEIRRIAMTNLQSADKFAKDQLGRYGQEAKALTSTGQRFGIVADNDSVFRYVTGQSEDAPIQEAPQRPTTPAKTPRQSSSSNVPSRQVRPTQMGPSTRQQQLLNSRTPVVEGDNVPTAGDVLSQVRARLQRRQTRRPVND